MKLFDKYMLLALAVLAVAQGCEKETINPQDTGTPIMLSATEAGTKALLEEETFKAAGNQIQIVDYYTPASQQGAETQSPFYYIGVDNNNRLCEYVQSEDSNSDTWPFQNDSYSWTEDGEHKFFGWLKKDVNITSTEGDVNYPASFFGSGFGFDPGEQTLTIPSKTVDASTPQFDFMYSNVHIRNLNETTPDFTSPVPLEFKHLFTAFSIAAQNMSPNFDITVESITIEGLMNTRSATIRYANAADEGYPIVTYTSSSNDDPEVADFSFTPSYELGTNLIDMSTKDTEREYFISWPMSVEESENVNITVYYKVDGDNTINKKGLSLSGKEWAAGKKNNINLVFKDKEIILQCLVMDWIPQDETIDFSNQVTVKDAITWENVRSVNYDTGEVILYDDTSIEAICNFSFTTPKGATWTAALIPIEGHQDAFTFIGTSKYGAVGVDTPVKLRVTNQAPIAPRHVCILRITIQTADGRTIVVKNMIEGKDNLEFKVIQNLING